MTFDEWAARLELQERAFEYFPPAANTRRAWRCDGPCGQLMYGITRIKSWNYPTEKVPAGAYISTDYPRVCSVCHAMYYYYVAHPDDRTQDRLQKYWDELRAKDKKKFQQLRREGDFFA